jgi:hypothetical protein
VHEAGGQIIAGTDAGSLHRELELLGAPMRKQIYRKGAMRNSARRPEIAAMALLHDFFREGMSP